MTSIWDTLGITAESNERDIKRAYAKRLKQTRPEEDPEGFQALRQAYEEALEYAAWVRKREARQQAVSPDDGVTHEDTATPAAPVAQVAHEDIASRPDQKSATPPSAEAASAPDSTSAASTPHADPAASGQNPADSTRTTRDGSHPARPEQDDPSIRADELNRVVAQLWEKFMSRTDTMNPRQVEIFLKSQSAFQNLSVREAFEFQACRYCAGEDALTKVRDALVEAFNWEHEIRHLQQIDPGLPVQAMRRFNADKVWQAVYYKESFQNPPLQAMLENRTALPRNAFFQITRPHVQHLQKWIHTLRWHYPEVLQYKVKPEILAHWESWAERKRYFKDHVVMSFVMGVFLAMFWGLISPTVQRGLFGIENPQGSDLYNWLVGESTAFIGVACYCFFPRRVKPWLAGQVQRFRHSGKAVYERYLSTLFEVHRLKPGIHLLVVANFGIASIMLGFHWQGYIQILPVILLAQAVLGLFFITSADLPPLKWLLAPIVGLIAAFISHDTDRGDSIILNWLFFTGYYLLFMRGHLAILREYGANTLEKLRCLWLVLALPLLAGAKFALLGVLPPDLLTPVMSHPLMLGLMWLLCLSGWQVCNFHLYKDDLPKVLLMIFVIPIFLAVVLIDLPPLALFLHLNLGIICAHTITNLIFARLERE